MNSINHAFHLKPIQGFEIIDRLPTNGYKNRLKRDLAQMRDKGYEICYIYIDDATQDLTINVCDKICNTIYTFSFNHSRYPFVPPNLQINYKSYFYFYRTTNEYVINAIQQYIGSNCMCCKSIVCPNNWSPANSLTNIIEEHKYFRNIIRKNAYAVYVAAIKRQYLIHDIDLMSWLF